MTTTTPLPRFRHWRGDRRDEGLAPVEMAMVAPVLLAFMMLALLAGRVSQAEHIVQRAASEAARAASLRQHPGDATDDAQDTVSTNLADSGLSCSPSTAVDTTRLEPGGQVSVQVACTVSFSDLVLLGTPGNRTITVTAVEVVDRYRAGEASP